VRIKFQSDDLALEGDLHIPARCAAGVVICHPHPQYGGDMHNAVVLAVAEGFCHAGYATLRFNFRGVGGSAGSYSGGGGEVDDARAAVRCLIADAGVKVVTIAGYSFGAMVALRAGPAWGEVHRLVAIAPPLAFFTLEHLETCAKPKLFVVGDSDQYCGLAQLTAQLERVAEPKHRCIVRGADHFFAGNLDAVRDAIAAFANIA
jgi:alpha/beta superfamily hydrolase